MKTNKSHYSFTFSGHFLLTFSKHNHITEFKCGLSRQPSSFPDVFSQVLAVKRITVLTAANGVEYSAISD